MKHQHFTQQKIQQSHHYVGRPQEKIHNSAPNSYRNYLKQLFWIPVIAGVLLLFLGIIKQYLIEEQKFYCYKTSFTPSKISKLETGREILINTRYGYKIYVDYMDKMIGQKIAQSGSFQPKIINLLGHIIKMGDQTLIIGSHYGLQAISIAKVAGEFGKTHVFQPTQFLFDLLNKNVAQNHLENVIKTYKKALSNVKSNETVQIIQPLESNQTQSISTEQIQYDVLDSVLSQKVKLNLAYINTKNMGIKTLIGMKQIIKRSPQLVIIMKWETRNREMISDSDYKSLINFLANQSFKAYNYEGGQFRKSCTVGSFLWRGGLQNLEELKEQFVILFPEKYSLPR